MKAVFTFSEAEIKEMVTRTINEICDSLINAEQVEFEWEHEGDDAILVATIENWEG